MRAIVALVVVLIMAPYIQGQSGNPRIRIMDQSRSERVSFIFKSEAEMLESKWIGVEVEAGGDKQQLSLWCLWEARQGLAFWSPVFGDYTAGRSKFLPGIWIDADILGLWSVSIKPIGLRMATSSKTAASLDEACETAVVDLAGMFERIRPRPGDNPLLHDPLGKTINLEDVVDPLTWVRLEGSSRPGGIRRISEIERTGEGWVVLVDALDGVKYQISLDRDFNLVGAVRVSQ